MKFNVNSSMSVGGNSISFSFQTKQKWNIEIQANEKNPGNKESTDIRNPH